VTGALAEFADHPSSRFGNLPVAGGVTQAIDSPGIESWSSRYGPLVCLCRLDVPLKDRLPDAKMGKC